MVGETTKKSAFFALIYLIFLAGFASASFTIGNPSNLITDTYSPGDTLNGWVNISLSSQPADSLIQSSLGGESISLIDLLQKNSNAGFSYTCNPVSCDANYLGTNEAPSKTLNLNENDSAIIGMQILGTYITSVSSFSMNIQSNSPETQKVPLKIDILDDGQTEWQTYTASGDFLPSSENFGCFGAAQSSANIVYGLQNQYCERISLATTPGVEIGAYVQGNVPANFNLKIMGVNGEGSGSCTASAAGIGSKERIACVPSGFQVENPGDYFVCIGATTNPSDPSNYYRINYEQTDPVCGFTGVYQNSYTYDFELFARQEEYAAGANFALNDQELNSIGSPVSSIEQYIKNYLANKYNNNCSKGCIIPIRLTSGVGQQISITNATLTFASGISTTIYGISDVQKTPAQISSSKYQKMYIDGMGITAPMDFGNVTFSLSMDGNTLVSKDISIAEEAPEIKSLSPTKTAVKYPTKFTVLLNSTQNISQIYWNFGDGGTMTTTSNSATYAYNNTGTYALKVTLSNAGGNSSKIFNVSIDSASAIIPLLIEEEQSGIDSVKNQSATFSPFEQSSINNLLNINSVQANLTKLQNAFANATTEDQFDLILGQLLAIKMPLTVAKTDSASGISFYPDGNSINLDTLAAITGETYDSSKESQYKQAILSWNDENIANSLVYSAITAVYEDYQEPLIKTFDISITKNGMDNAYLIIKDMGNLAFRNDYSQKKINGYYYITLNNGANDIAFSTTDIVNFVNVPMFISPAISSLSLSNQETVLPWNDQSNQKWVLFGVIIGIILLIVAVVYVLLHLWYKRKYEDHLFKNKNNLYNLLTYIRTSREKGMKDGEIASSLKKAGWNSEQASYALKKYAGKRIGMPGMGLFGKRKKKIKK